MDSPPDVMEIVSADGHHFEASLHLAADDSAHAPVMIFFAALGTPARVYSRFAKAIAAHGISVCLFDWRGLCSSSVRASRRSNFGYRQLIEIDASALLAAVGKRLPDSPVWLAGHSLGGQLAPLVAVNHPNQVTGMLLIASGSVYLPGYSPLMRLGIRVVGLIARLSSAIVGYFPGQSLGFGGREARGVMEDWLHVAHTGRYQPRGSVIDYERLLAELELPLRVINFAADTWAPKSAARHLTSKMGRSALTWWQEDPPKNDGTPIDHFSWTKKPDRLVPSIVTWINEQTLRSSATAGR